MSVCVGVCVGEGVSVCVGVDRCDCRGLSIRILLK